MLSKKKKNILIYRYINYKTKLNINNYANWYINTWNTLLALFNRVIINMTVNGSGTTLINFTHLTWTYILVTTISYASVQSITWFLLTALIFIPSTRWDYLPRNGTLIINLT